MSDDNWVKAAMDDADLVVDVLVRLRQASPPSQPKPDTPPPPLGWSIRQRRSRPQVLPPAAAKKSPAARASPTTPLSWSGATSVSGGGVANVDGIEESSRRIPNRSGTSRSKVMRLNETTPTKRPRKKKTLAELKEEEMALSKERKQLKRELATLQATFEKQRKENETLKKMKMDLQSQPQGAKREAVVSGEPHQTVAASQVNNCIEAKEDGFVLPDLNIPAGEDE